MSMNNEGECCRALQNSIKPVSPLTGGAVWEHGGIQAAESPIGQKAVESLRGESQLLQVECAKHMTDHPLLPLEWTQILQIL